MAELKINQRWVCDEKNQKKNILKREKSYIKKKDDVFIHNTYYNLKILIEIGNEQDFILKLKENERLVFDILNYYHYINNNYALYINQQK